MTPRKKKFVVKYDEINDWWMVRLRGHVKGNHKAAFWGDDAEKQARAHAKRLNELQKEGKP